MLLHDDAERQRPAARSHAARDGPPERGVPVLPPLASIHGWFEAQAARTPDAPAVRYESAWLTYAALNQRANLLARRLMHAGVGPEVLVGLCLDRCLDMIVGILGILKAGGAYVPLDPDNPAARTRLILEDAKPPVIVTQTWLRERLANAEAETVCLDIIDWEHPEGRENPRSAVAAENLAYVIYTSGSTGQPKGTLVTHRNVVRLFRTTEAWFGFGPDDVWTVFHSFAFDFSVWELWGALLYGGKAIIVSGPVARSPESFHALLRDEGVTVLCQTPSAFYPLIEADGAAAPQPPLALRCVIFGGEALEFRRLKPWFGRHGDDPKLINMYGITETTVHATYYAVANDALGSESTIGVPLPDLQIHLLDEDRVPVPPGTIGEIYVGGPGVARGYLNRPDLTAERFIPDAFSGEKGAPLYRSGDRARARTDGQLEFCGRADDQVKLRGHRIELGEIEAALNRHPDIAQSSVVLRDGPSGEKELVSYVIAETAAVPSPARLRADLCETLPAYMVPSAFVPLPSWPLTHNGKLDRAALPAPRREHRVALAAAAPRTETEARVVAVWAEALATDEVGIHDDFFELGGNSLTAARVCTRLRNDFDVPLAIADILTAPTVATLANTIDTLSAAVGDEEARGRIGNLIHVQPGGSKPPIFALFGVGGSFLAYAAVTKELGPDQPFYSLEMPGLEGDDIAVDQVDEVALRFRDEMRDVRAGEPCILIGACAGALVVFELARHLRAQGREVKLVVMLDPPPCGTDRPLRLSAHRLWRRLALPRFLLGRVGLLLRMMLTLRGRDRREFLKQKLSVIREIFRERDLLRDSRQEFHVIRVLEATSVALSTYEPQPYAGDVALLLGDRYPPGGAEDPTAEWRKLCTGSFETGWVPGKDTGTMLRSPNVGSLVARLNALLDHG
jgi:amino acid adenylation domain-containing protein